MGDVRFGSRRTGFVIEIDPPDGQRVHVQSMGHMVHHTFNAQHPLRPTKAAVGGGGLHVGLQAVAFDANMIKLIGVVRMQHCAVCDGQRQILRPAATGIMMEVDAQNAAALIIADIIVDTEIMTLAGDDHIVVSVIAHLARTPGLLRGNRTSHRKRVALTFLAAKATTHAAGFHADRIHWQPNGMGHLMLDLGRVLGRGIHHHIAIILRRGEGGLAF